MGATGWVAQQCDPNPKELLRIGMDMQSFEIVGEITEIEVLAVGSAIREIGRLRKQYGDGRWQN